MIDTLDELTMIGVPIVRAVPTGRQYRASNGKMKDETQIKEFVRLASGDEITLDKWYERMERAVEAEGKSALLKKIEEEVEKNCAWLKTGAQIRRYALDCLSTGAYKAWGKRDSKTEERHHE